MTPQERVQEYDEIRKLERERIMNEIGWNTHGEGRDCDKFCYLDDLKLIVNPPEGQ